MKKREPTRQIERGLDGSLADAEPALQDAMGAEDDAARQDVPAHDGINSPHIRQRLYWCAIRVADNKEGRRGQVGTLAGGCAEGSGAQGRERPEHGGSAGGLGHAERIPAGRDTGAGAETEGEAQLRAECDAVGSSGDTGGLVQPDGAGRESGRSASPTTRHGSAAEPAGDPSRNPWGNVIAVPCADGKSRLLESCLEPLADGFSAQLVRGGDPGAPPVAFPPLVTQQTEDLNDTSEARTMRLKGYGNSITIGVAVTFIEAVIDVIQEQNGQGRENSSEQC